ncbi:uncharacterized protein LOC17883026 [Capsella rubella]|nr:uncharacterized protein LOC17883026 [Capsella rubella]
MILTFLSYIFCFGEMASLYNHFVDSKTSQSVNHFDIEKQLNVINKPAVKIIKTTHGDTYGCVDLYKQPAFEHMSVKNKLFLYNVRRISSLKKSRVNHENFGISWDNGIGCPIGTVPIKRVTKDELLGLNLFSTKYKPRGSWNSTSSHYNVDNDQQHHFAVSRTKGGKNKKYNGATMIVSLNDPKVKLPQYSSARMHIQIGDDFIQIGWIVNPKLYGDTKPRTFVYTKAGNNQCYNSMCQIGIILVRSDIPFGVALEPVCVRGSNPSASVTIAVYKDKINGNWWLDYGEVTLGFWPASRFKQSYANNVEWGGEVYSAFMSGAQMGNGYFPKKHPLFDAIIFNITTVDEKFEIDKLVNNTETFSDNTRGYKVIEDLYSDYPVGHIIYFGGPGNI